MTEPATPKPPARSRFRRSRSTADAAARSTVGIVFVHGIGSQRPGETLLDWSRPLIRLLTEWRTALGLPPDPVVASDIDFSGATLPTIELAIPGAPAGPADAMAEPQRWILTEAWWAARVEPPSLGSMTR